LTILFDYNKTIIESFLENLNINGYCENLDKYYDFKKKHSNGIAIFNHTSHVDGVILLNELKEPISVVCAKNIIIELSKKLVQKWKCLVVEPNKSTTKQITEKVLSRKNSEPLLFIAPSGAEGMEEQDENKIGTFKTGAFVSLSPVLPVIIKYNPYVFTEDVHIIESMINIINKPKISYCVKILDPIYPKENDNIETFKNRVYEIMTIEKNKITVKNIEQKDNKKLYIIIISLLILSYALFSYDFKDYILVLLFLILIIVICLRNTSYIYDYVYKNLIYIYGIVLGLYSICNENYLLFINSIIYPIVYKIFSIYS
tara:strand:- start:544 stop:1488 length:945 start_codon:yes stop_codon:yes gene_type:complete